MRHIKNAVERTVRNARNSIIGSISSIIKKEKTIFVKVADEEIRDIKIYTPYGFFSFPRNNDMAQVLFNNTTKKPTVVGVEHKDVPIEIEVGEVLMYNPISKSYIHLKNEGDIKLYNNVGKNYIHLKDDGSIEIGGTTVNFKKV